MGGKNNRIRPQVGCAFSYGVKDAVLVIRKAPATILARIRMDSRSNDINVCLALEDEREVRAGVLVPWAY